MFHVKPSKPPIPPLSAEIQRALRECGLEPTSEQADRLRDHALAVLEANAVTNLTRITEPQEFLRLHIVDSLLPLTYLDLTHGRVLDIGSGAGFPGIPLAVMGCQVSLCETRKKKAAYLARWVDELELTADVVADRAEELAASGVRYDWVIMRAVSALPSLLELASPLLRTGGRLVAMKGPRTAEEETRAGNVGPLVGMTPATAFEYSLPRGDERRTLYVYERKGPSRVSLPRRPGLAQTQPLG